MARDFDGSTHYAEFNAAILTAMPITMACWFRPDIVTALETLMSISRNNNTTQFWAIYFAGATAGDPIRAAANQSGTQVNAVSTAGANGVASVWYHAAGVFASSTDKRAFFNGGNRGNNTTANTPANTVNKTNIATYYSALNTRTSFFNGRIAEAGIWNVALDDDEIAALGAGLCPLLMRPQSLIGYWPLIGYASPEDDWHPRSVNATDRAMTLTGPPTQANHSPTTLWFPPTNVSIAEAAAVTGNPWHYYHQMHGMAT